MGVSDSLGRSDVDAPPPVLEAGRRVRADALRLAREGSYTEANASLHQLLSAQVHSVGDRHPEYAATMELLADLQVAAEAARGAEPLYRHVLQLRREAFGTRHPETATTQAKLANVLRRKGELDSAEALYSESLEIFAECGVEPEPAVLGQLADLYNERKEPEKAEALVARLLELAGTRLGPNEPAPAGVLGNAALLAQARGQLKRAEGLLRDALTSTERSHGADSPEHAQVLSDLAQLLARRGEPAEAEQLLRRALEIRKQVGGERDPATFTTLHALALVVWKRGDLAAGRLLLREALGLVKQVHGEAHPDYARSLAALGAVQLGLGDPEKAEPLLRRALEIRRQTGSEESLDHADNLIGLAELYQSRGAWRRAEALWGQAQEIRQRLLGSAHPDTEDAARGRAEAEEAAAQSTPPAAAAGSGRPLVPPLPAMSWKPLEALVLPPATPPAGPVPDGRALEPFAPSALPETAAAETHGLPLGATLPAPNVSLSEPLNSPAPVSPSELRGYSPIEPQPAPDRTSPMSFTSTELSQELSALSDRFSDLGERMLHAARQLHAPGVLPTEDLWHEFGSCRGDFEGLRHRATQLAESLFVSVPSPDRLGSLQGITDLLDGVADAEIRRSSADEFRNRALGVLDRVLALSHASVADFAPLLECQDRARGLRQGIAEAAWSSPHAETGALAEGEHPFAHLLNLIDDHDELHDDHWAHLHDSVSTQFGKSLAAAAARSKLVSNPVEGYHHGSENHVAVGSY